MYFVDRHAARLRGLLLFHFLDRFGPRCLAVVDLHAVRKRQLLLRRHFGLRHGTSETLGI